MSNYRNKANKRAIEMIEKDINLQVRLKKPHWNNLVATYLEEADLHHGEGSADRLIARCGLEQHGWKPSAPGPAAAGPGLTPEAREELEAELGRFYRDRDDAEDRHDIPSCRVADRRIVELEKKLGIAPAGGAE